MAYSLPFAGRHDWGKSGTNRSYRPYSAFSLDTPSGQPLLMWGLMDTGADFLMLDKAIAPSIGVDLAKTKHTTKVVFANGASTTLPTAQVWATIEGKRVRTIAIFGTVGTPLIGRVAILDAMNFGIDSNGWLFDPIP